MLAKLRLYFDTPGGDVDHAAELYRDDAVLEFPQSGERFEGRETFTRWRAAYPAEVAFEVLRVTVREDLAVVELSASYDGGPTMFGVGLLEFTGDRISRERIYMGEGWEPPERRQRWLAPAPAETPGWS
ncbi:nuclear transport factor 2 family protein [Agrococcus sp. DT81.2]|uniref:nuclear transport factor 2 family protein n=1 Tax=Agrococcus sp. DT81.2 TaxID=3393414 RepID=UPI003CE4EE58